jgi:diguanylate cyclase (GGDEF)-like protein/PAS domain S-box-containing protein
MEVKFPASVAAQFARAASAAFRLKKPIGGPIGLTVVCAVLLSVIVVSGSSVFLYNAHNRIRTVNERNLASNALILAKQIKQFLTTVRRVQEGIIKETAALVTGRDDDIDGLLSRHDVYLKLRDKAAGMPYVGSLTIINAQGQLINFSRQWPTPNINAADRDFFKALKSDPNLTSFIGKPIHNRATGSWVIQLARKISGPNGEFLGLTTAAVELKYLQNYLGEFSLDPDNAVTLFRQDGTVLARFPQNDPIIGHRFASAAGLKLVASSDEGVGSGAGVLDGDSRMVAAHRVGGFPIVITTSKANAAIYAGWRQTVAFVIAISVLTIITIAAFASLFIRLFENYQALVQARAEQQKAEQLRQQGLRFNVALNNMSQGLVMFDASARVVVCNTRYMQMYGLSPEVVKPGLTLPELIKHRKESGSFTGDPDEFCAQILEHVAKGEPSTQSVETADGRMIYVINQPMADGGWVSTHEDITERRKVERERDYNRNFLDMVIENVPSTIVVKNARDFSYALINRSGQEYYGMPRDKMIGKTAYDLLPKESANYLTELDKKLLNVTQQPVVDEHTLEMPGGEKHVALSKRLCICGENGEPQYLLAVVDDITAQRETENKIRVQKQQLDAAIGNMAQGLVMFDSSERVVLCNQRCIEISGLSPDFMRPGRTLREILQVRQAQGSFSRDIEEYRRELLQDLANGKTKSLFVETNDGRSCKVVNVPMAGGGWVATHEDVTEKVRAEKVNEQQKLQLDAALENMSQGLCLFDASQRLIVCNKRYAELYGLNDTQTKPGTSLRAILEHRIARGTAPEDHEGYIKDRLNEVSINQPYQIVNRLRDGRYVSVIHRPMPGGGWVATHEDVTEAKAREESFRLLFEGNPVPMWVTDRESLRFIAVNEAAISHYGYTREQFLAMTVAGLRPAADRDRFAQHMRTLPDVQMTGNIGQHWKADGNPIDVIVFSRTLNYAAQQARLAVIHDITKVTLAENELRRTKKFLDTVIEHVPVSIVVKDVAGLDTDASGGRFTLFNRAYEELTGDSRASLIGKTAHQIYPKDRADIIVRSDSEALQSTHAVTNREHPILTSCNGTRLVTAKKTVIRNDNGKPQYLLTVLEDVTERRRAEQHISYLAYIDSLTDLPNRATSIEYLAESLDKASKSGEQFAVLCLDLDRFKEANDVYGHLIGDSLLCEAARRMQTAAAGAFLARVGGDGFTLVVTNGPQPETAKALGERLLAAFRDDFEIEGHRIQIGLSIGGAVYPSDGTDARELLANADAALYRAKAEMRGSMRFFDGEIGSQLRERHDLQNDLRAAFNRGDFFLHYQPQQRIGSKETIGFETLARWHCPKRGMVSPGIFIPIAEDSKLIIPLGEWILREACREAASWLRPLTVAVNVSPVQFHHGDLPRLVHSILLETGLAPDRLELEITEGVLIDDFSRAVSILRRLKSLGVQIAMDDFGSGYSSLSYLHAFPFDKIKIDSTFIGNLEHNHHSMAIVRAIITLGHSLNVPILAEGVETEAQFTFLVREGCDEVQGYLTGRPRSIETYARLIGRNATAKRKKAAAG